METTEKALIHDATLCTGCMRCMTTCSTYNFGATSLSKSRIQIVRHEGHAITRMDEEDELIFQPMMCQQCDKPRCMEMCPPRAITRNADTKSMIVNYDRCIGCRMCILVCPFGAMRYDTVRRKVFKCELCEGDPQCVKFCPTGALQFLPKDISNVVRIDSLARKLIEIQRTPVELPVEVKR